jgi:hypothetical protein
MGGYRRYGTTSRYSDTRGKKAGCLVSLAAANRRPTRIRWRVLIGSHMSASGARACTVASRPTVCVVVHMHAHLLVVATGVTFLVPKCQHFSSSRSRGSLAGCTLTSRRKIIRRHVLVLLAVQPNFAFLFGSAVSELHMAQLDLPGRATFCRITLAPPATQGGKKNRRGCRPRRGKPSRRRPSDPPAARRDTPN